MRILRCRKSRLRLCTSWGNAPGREPDHHFRVPRKPVAPGRLPRPAGPPRPVRPARPVGPAGSASPPRPAGLHAPQACTPGGSRRPGRSPRPAGPPLPAGPASLPLPASPVGRAGSEKHQRASLRHRRSIFCLKRSIWCFFEFSSLILHRCDQALWRFLFQICNLRREKKHQTSRMRHDFESRCRRRSVRCPWAGLCPGRRALLCPYLPAWSTLLPRTWFAAA